MTKALGSGDVVMVTRIDRLARSTFDLFAIVKQILDAGAQFRSLAEPRADIATSTGQLMVVILGGLADVERDLIHTHDGRARKSQGERQAPRPPVQDPHKSQEVLARRESGELLTEIAGSYKVQCGERFQGCRDEQVSSMPQRIYGTVIDGIYKNIPSFISQTTTIKLLAIYGLHQIRMHA